jgi:hypothetical protein
MLTDEQKQKCMGAALSLLKYYHREGDKFLHHIITDETWVLRYSPESKWQFQEWHHAHSPTTTKNTKIQADMFSCKNHDQLFLEQERCSFD